MFIRAIIIILLFASSSRADESAIVDGMRDIKEAWEKLIDSRTPFFVNCPDRSMALVMFTGRSVVEFDVLRTDSITKPYKGTIRFFAYLVSNQYSEQSDGTKTGVDSGYSKNGYACYSSGEKALSVVDENNWTPYSSSSRRTEVFMEYDIVDGHLLIRMSRFGEPIKLILDLMRPSNPRSWAPVVERRLAR
ncbi:MAG: hypothetical protein GC150_17210 [Rhizobiales bacterium]|nr:hypothetical protein [Hyphomicrobiales bacterium]